MPPAAVSCSKAGLSHSRSVLCLWGTEMDLRGGSHAAEVPEGAEGPRRGTPVPAGQVACQAGDSENAGSAGCEPGDRRCVEGTPTHWGASLWFLRALGVQALSTPGSGNEQLPCSELEDLAETFPSFLPPRMSLTFSSLSSFLTQWLIGGAQDGSRRVAHVPQPSTVAGLGQGRCPPAAPPTPPISHIHSRAVHGNG